MVGNNHSSSIFRQTDEIIASFLGLGPKDKLKHRSVSRRLSMPGTGNGGFAKLVSDLFDCIVSNCSGRMPSRENWRSTTVTTLSGRNKSPEVLLERAIAMLGESGILPGWINQVPVASGLVDDRADKRAAIDLVKLDGEKARFIELKWESDTPAFAAFEILRYGLVYLFCRANAARFDYAGYHLMQANRIDLEVLAPAVYFAQHELGWLEHGLQKATNDLAAEKVSGQLSIGFQFLAFPPEFEIPFSDGERVRAGCEKIPPSADALRVCDALDRLSPVWSNETNVNR